MFVLDVRTGTDLVMATNVSTYLLDPKTDQNSVLDTVTLNNNKYFRLKEENPALLEED